jgi:hypothetical protein
MMGEAGNSASDEHRRRLEIALRSFSADRVLEKARAVKDLGLADALDITLFLVRHDDPRADRALGQLFGRLVIERGGTLDDADALHGHLRALPDPEAESGIRRYIRR